MTINELMDKARTRANLQSDYALAKALGIDRSIISQWRKGKKHPSTTEAAQLAALAGLEEMPVIAAIEYQTATTEKKKQFWKCYLEQHGITAGMCMIALGVSILLTPEPTEANILHLRNYDAQNSAQNKTEIYIMRISGRFWGGTVRGTVSPQNLHLTYSSTPCCKLTGSTSTWG